MFPFEEKIILAGRCQFTLGILEAGISSSLDSRVYYQVEIILPFRQLPSLRLVSIAAHV